MHCKRLFSWARPPSSSSPRWIGESHRLTVPFIETFLKSKVKSRVTSWGKAIMRLCISDSVPWDYNVETPYHRAFGGMQSAACYLSAALAKQGHEVSLLTHTNRPGTWLGVECLSWNDADSIDRMRRASGAVAGALMTSPEGLNRDP